MKNKNKILVTGCAGFIGYHLTKALLSQGFDVVGIDNLNDYYDPQLKMDRLDELDIYVNENSIQNRYHFFKQDISNLDALRKIFEQFNFDLVFNLAAQAGVRYSLENPSTYIKSNLEGFANILECSRHNKIKHLIFASSSSVYGMNVKQPFSVSDSTDYPVSLYAATKKSNELMAFSYSHLFKIPCTGLRFFTVYGPFGRPDMAYYKFASAISENRTIELFNAGKMKRDFTYIDDIIDGMLKVMDKAPAIKSFNATYAEAPYRLFNIGNNSPVKLSDFIETIELTVGRKAIIRNLPMQPGDVPETYADIDDLFEVIKFKPSTKIREGIKKFVDWLHEYNNGT
ncbi:MAG: NAD-dependent epimerase/dehydratase family protein [Gammaproteobacteria bacterium]